MAAGFRHFDTAQAPEWYDEASVGAALNASGVARREFFLTTKMHPRDHGYESTKAAVASSLANLRTTYVDLFMLHFPECSGMCTPAQVS